jgi:hypothetical protein
MRDVQDEREIRDLKFEVPNISAFSPPHPSRFSRESRSSRRLRIFTIKFINDLTCNIESLIAI